VIADYDVTPPAWVARPHAKPKSPTVRQRTSIRWRLSEAATITVKVERCKRRCRKLVAFKVDASAGRGKHVFLDHQFLPGRHRILLRATDGAGNSSSPATVRLRVRR
jgi:hypothetical protein